MKDITKRKLLKIQDIKKRRIFIDEFEKEIIKSFSLFNEYHSYGGYEAFYQAVLTLEKEGLLRRQRVKKDNGREPSLPLQWWVMPKAVVGKWNTIDMLKVSDLLNLRKFKGDPELQTLENWKHIIAVHTFLKEASERELVSREQRSYELFGREKFLSEKVGREFLSKLGLTLKDLRAKIYSEPFIFSTLNLKPYTEMELVLIVENHSTYHTLHHFFQQYSSFRGFRPDLLIYGEGKKIESSAKLFYDMFPPKEYDVYYFGDIDAEGWGIYNRLKENKIWSSLQLSVLFYQALIDYAHAEVPYKNHDENPAYLQGVQEELKGRGEYALANCIEELWKKRQRLPQEAITLEKMRREVERIE
ncbi:hypothetical protein CEW92_14145 [Bacillaceae bacterium SAS-127]|nr:hypothetical protein CEW92_14145 [Bacillaceae bacterium SAS-127]